MRNFDLQHVIQHRDARTVDEKWDAIRYVRNELLLDCDWTQLADVPTEIRTEWATYRQQLRDLPQTYSNPDQVVLPAPPAGRRIQRPT